MRNAQPHPDCEAQMHKAMEEFHNDQMTQAYGGSEAGGLIMENHIKKCAKCKEYNRNGQQTTNRRK